MTSSKPTLSIFGSTGGTGLSVLRPCLRAEYHCTVLVRQPGKLLELLSLPEAPSNLHIVQGDINDIASVQKALLTPDGRLVDIVVSAIGVVGDFSLSGIWHPFANVDPKLCEKGTKNIVDAISNLQQAPGEDAARSVVGQKMTRPLLVVVSTTGITSAGRDIPIMMMPFYHYFLAIPHKDKRAVEDYLSSSAVSSSQSWIAIRPSFLVGDGKGEHTQKKIRVGVERNGKHENRAIGYTIEREDVGYWIFTEIIDGDWKDRIGTAVTLTH